MCNCVTFNSKLPGMLASCSDDGNIRVYVNKLIRGDGSDRGSGALREDFLSIGASTRSFSLRQQLVEEAPDAGDDQPHDGFTNHIQY